MLNTKSFVISISLIIIAISSYIHFFNQTSTVATDNADIHATEADNTYQINTLANNPAELATEKPTKAVTDNQQTLFSQALQKAKNFYELKKTIETQLLINEEAAIAAWAEFNTPLLEENYYEFALIFKEYFSKYYSALTAMEKFAPVRANKFNHFRTVIVELLEDHNEHDSPEDLIAFLDDPAQESIAELVPQAIGHRIAKDDPIRALDLINSLGNPAIKQLAMEAAYVTWTVQDKHAVSEHMKVQPNDERYDRVIENLSARFLSENVNESIAWAEAIIDDDLRHEQVLSSARVWQKSGEQSEAYQAWLDTVEEPELKAKLEQQHQDVEKTTSLRNMFTQPYGELEMAAEENAVTQEHVDNVVAAIYELEQQYQNNPDDTVIKTEWDNLRYNLNTRRYQHLRHQSSQLRGLLKQYPAD